MARLGISTGTTPNDGTGDTLLSGAVKINSNFAEIYGHFGDGNSLTAIGGTWSVTSVGIHTLKNVGIGTTNPISTLTVRGNVLVTGTGIITATSFSGNATSATYSTTAGIATYATSSGIATYSEISGIATYATSSGIATYSTTAGIATYATTAGIATYAISSGIATVSQGLTGSPNLNVGIVTASQFIGDGSGLTGITATGSGIEIRDDGSIVGTAATIDFGTGLSVSPISAGVVTVTASGGTSSQWISTAAGIHTLSNVGIGTTNPITRFQVGSANTSSFFVVNNLGSVGIGTTNPDYYDGFGTLTLDGRFYDYGDAIPRWGGGIIIFKSRGNTVSEIYSYTDPNGLDTATNLGLYGNFYVLNSSGQNLITLNSSSRSVGIGTTNPISKLTVERYGVKTGFGTFSATAGIATDIDTFTIASTDFKTSEYTLHVQHSSGIQAQKVLVMQNGTTAYSQEYAIMYEPSQIVSIGATISGGILKLQATPETGITGLTTYRFTTHTMI